MQAGKPQNGENVLLMQNIMNTITHNNYGCANLHARECETLSGGGFLETVVKILHHIVQPLPDSTSNTATFAESFIEGFKEGWKAAER